PRIPNVESDLFGDGDGLARQLQLVGVERLGHQGTFTHEEKIAWRGVSRGRLDIQHQACLFRVERADENPALLSLRAARDVQEVPTVGQEVGPRVKGFIARLIEYGYGGGRASGARDAVQTLSSVARKDDDPVAVPRAPGRRPRIA